MCQKTKGILIFGWCAAALMEYPLSRMCVQLEEVFWDNGLGAGNHVFGISISYLNHRKTLFKIIQYHFEHFQPNDNFRTTWTIIYFANVRDCETERMLEMRPTQKLQFTRCEFPRNLAISWPIVHVLLPYRVRVACCWCIIYGGHILRPLKAVGQIWLLCCGVFCVFRVSYLLPGASGYLCSQFVLQHTYTYRVVVDGGIPFLG